MSVVSLSALPLIVRIASLPKKFLEDAKEPATLVTTSLNSLKPCSLQVDLQQLFEMIDVDASGAIEAQEFIAPLSRSLAAGFVRFHVFPLCLLKKMAASFDKSTCTYIAPH